MNEVITACEVTRVTLHLGAHKTASTHLNTVLRANPELSAAHSVGVPNKSQTRQGLTRKLGKYQAVPRNTKTEDAVVLDLSNGRPAVFLSDENILGVPKRLMSELGFYPNAARRLRTTLNLIGDYPVELLLAIRSQPSFIVSTYAEAIRSEGYIAFDEFVGDTDLKMMRWSRLIRRILAVRPDLTITVWRYEDYGDLLPTILGLIMRANGDVSVGDLNMPEDRVRLGLSARAVDEIKALQDELGQPPERNQIEEIMEQYPKSKDSPAPQPLDDERRKLLERNYRKDLRAIAKMERVTLMS